MHVAEVPRVGYGAGRRHHRDIWSKPDVIERTANREFRREQVLDLEFGPHHPAVADVQRDTAGRCKRLGGIAVEGRVIECVADLELGAHAQLTEVPAIANASHQGPSPYGSELGTARTMQVFAEHGQRNWVLPAIGTSRAEPDRGAERDTACDVVVGRVAEAHISVHAYLANEGKDVLLEALGSFRRVRVRGRRRLRREVVPNDPG